MKLHLTCHCRLGMLPKHRFLARVRRRGTTILSTDCCLDKDEREICIVRPVVSDKLLIYVTVDELWACFERSNRLLDSVHSVGIERNPLVRSRALSIELRFSSWPCDYSTCAC